MSDSHILLAAKGGGIAFAGNLFVYGARFAFGLLMARLLGADLLGLYSLASLIPEIVSVLALLGLGAGMARFIPIAVGQKDESRIWGTIQVGIALPAFIGLALSPVVFMAADALSIRLFARPDLAPVLRLASLGIPLLALIESLTAITQGFKRMEYKVYAADITLTLLKLILAIVFLGLGWSVMGAMAAYVVSLAVTTAMLFYFVHRLFSLRRPLSHARRNAGEMLRFTIPFYFSQLLRQFSGSLETLVLGLFGVMSGVGVYTAALRLSDIGGLFYNSLERIANPMVSDLTSRNKLEELGQLYRTTTKWATAFNLPIFLISVLFAKPLLALFGAEFVAGATGLTILAFASLFNAATGICGPIVTMSGHSRLSLLNSVLYLGTNIGLDLLLIPTWGVLGAACAAALTIVELNILRLAQTFLLYRLWPYDRDFGKPLAAGLIAALATYPLSGWLDLAPALVQVIVGTGVLCGIYVVCVLTLRISDQDRLVLAKLWDRLNVRQPAS